MTTTTPDATPKRRGNTRYAKGDPFPQCARCGRDLEHYPGQWLRKDCGPYGCEEEFYSSERGRSAKRPIDPDLAVMTDDYLNPRGDASGYILDPYNIPDEGGDHEQRAEWAEIKEIRKEEDALDAAEVRRSRNPLPPGISRAILRALRAAPGRELPVMELVAKIPYDAKDQIRARRRLARGGALEIEGTGRAAIVRLTRPKRRRLTPDDFRSM